MKRPIDTSPPNGTSPNSPRRSFLRGATALSATALLGACGLELPGQGPPPRLFRLSPKSTFDADMPKVDWQLVIEEPLAPTGLNTTRIPLHRRATELEYYARANWTDRAPAMVHTLVVESFENSGQIVAVGRESLGLRADYVLKLELREFQAQYTGEGPPEANVRINAKLVQMPKRAIIGSQRFEARVGAGSDSLQEIVTAFDEALGKTLKDLVGWTLRKGEATRK
ncbi:MAG: ABC-type transport auxiliary lipoprotein family protein [Alphaproteobacteria bacterium]|jgi:cholesterol transport system auxiliary component